MGTPRVYLFGDDNYKYGYIEGGQFGTIEIDNKAYRYVLYDIVTYENAEFFVYSNKIYIPAADGPEDVEFFSMLKSGKQEHMQRYRFIYSFVLKAEIMIVM